MPSLEVQVYSKKEKKEREKPELTLRQKIFPVTGRFINGTNPCTTVIIIVDVN
jgi:hypothetical protein